MPSSSRQPRPRPEFLFLGGHRAVDFANTAVPPPGPGIDFLQEWSDVVDWLSDARLSDSAALHLPSSKGKAALAALKGFRDDWRNELARVLAEGSVSDDFMGRINRHLNEEPFTESLCRTGYTGLHLVRSASKLRGGKLALALVARQVAQFLADANLAYLRRCA
ncbi:MAG: ABATE domain-containing protein, partial [Opitutaceae bacterium]